MSFVEVSRQEWTSQLLGAMDFEKEFSQKYSIRTKLGRGTYGKVLCARSTRHGKRWSCAVKIMEKKPDDVETLTDWAEEWHIWHTLCPHPNILQLYEVYFGQNGAHQAVAMVSELMDRDLRVFMMHYCRVGLEDARTWMLDLCTGLGHMHSHQVAHRDVKPANCLLKHQPGGPLQLVIGDFGQAALLYPKDALADKKVTARSLNESPCTWAYAAPEVVHKHGYDFKLDIWSAGAILWQMLQALI